MSGISESIVREYFELHGFLVRQQRKHVSPARRQGETIDFFVLNPNLRSDLRPLPFILTSKDLPGLNRAVVVIRGWHTETFSPNLLANQPEIFQFADSKIFQRAATAFGGDDGAARILVVPALPQAEVARSQSVELLRSKGIDGVISFHSILRDLVDTTDASHNYQKSDLLQIIRILKNYDLLREPQLELFKQTSKGSKSRKVK